jgi:transcriptional regulator with XRE-family HTH domain
MSETDIISLLDMTERHMISAPSMLPITASQVRQARAQLGWSQRQLAQTANLAVSTIADFERGVRVPTAANLDAVRTALEKAGLGLERNGGTPLTVIRLSNRPLAGGLASSLITASDFEQWSGLPAQGLLPRLLGALIRAGAGSSLRQCAFPWENSVQYSGPDGECQIDPRDAPYPPEMLPVGRSLWELTTEKADPFGKRGKATQDARKRENELTPEERQEITFVFVTTHRTNHKRRENWIRERKAVGGWRDVRVLDADKMAECVNMFPNVAAWLAVMMGKPEAGCRRLQDAWTEWAETPEPPLTASILLAGRDEAAAQVWAWLRSSGDAPLFVQGETSEEVVAFLHAAISELPEETRDALLARSVIADTAEQARRLGSSLVRQVIVLNELDPDIAHGIARKGHLVVAAYPGRTRFEVMSAVTLPHAPRFDLQLLLEVMFVNDQLDGRRRKAAQLAKDAGGSLGILRDLMTAEFRRPDWVAAPQVATLRTLVLVGGWNAKSEEDQAIVATLARRPYGEVERDLIEWTERPGAPLRKIGDTWKLASPRHAYFWLAPGLTAADLDLFERIALRVLGEVDPVLALPPDQRFYAAFRGVKPKCSPLLEAGVCDTLALLAVLPDRVAPAEPDAASRVARIVGQLLRGADRMHWISLSSHLTALAEAAPEAFIAAVEASLDQGQAAPVLVLLEVEPGSFGRSYRAELLWALEILAWGKDCFERVTAILALLALLDPNPDTNWVNKPQASLAELFAILMPRAPLPWRFRFTTLRALVDALPARRNVFIRALFSIISNQPGMRTVGPFPEWRTFETDDPPDVRDWNSVPWSYITPALADASGLLIELIRNRPGWWPAAIKAIDDLPSEVRAQFLGILKTAAPNLNDDATRRELAAALREFVGHHRSFPGEAWAMPESELGSLAELHDLLQPRESVLRHLWLFADTPVALLHPTGDWQADENELSRQRADAVTRLSHEGGEPLLHELVASNGVNRGIIGLAIGRAAIPDRVKDDFLRRSLLSVDEQESAVAQGIVFGLSPDPGDRTKRLDAWLEVARMEKWPTGAVARLLLLFDSNPETWRRTASLGPEVKRAYWEKQWLLPPGLPAADVNLALRELIAAGRPARALHEVIHRARDKIAPAMVAELLAVAVEDDQKSGKLQLKVYEVEKAFDLLDRSGEVSDDTIAELEFKLLPYLEHSRRRGQLAIHRVMAREPSLFRDVLCLAYRPRNELRDERQNDQPSEREVRIAGLCWGLLRNWQTVPGLHNGAVDRVVLEDWIARVRALCSEADRLEVCDARIGNMLAHAPSDSQDDMWPCRAVREILPVFGSDDIESGLAMGERNKCSMTVRGPRDGGEQERELQDKYAGWAKGLRLAAPRAARVLDQLARIYDADAKREDDQAKRLDW